MKNKKQKTKKNTATADHARKRVADKDPRRVPVVREESDRGGDKRHHDRCRKDVCVADLGRRLDKVVREHRAGDDEGLAGLEAVDAGVDVDAVGAKHREQCHVHPVQGADLDGASQVPAEQRRHDDRGRPAVPNDERQRRKEREHQLVPPRDVQHVVHKAEEEHQAHRGQRRVVRDQHRRLRLGHEPVALHQDHGDNKDDPGNNPERFGTGGRGVFIYFWYIHMIMLTTIVRCQMRLRANMIP
jgi:hypothetical protein